MTLEQFLSKIEPLCFRLSKASSSMTCDEAFQYSSDCAEAGQALPMLAKILREISDHIQMERRKVIRDFQFDEITERILSEVQHDAEL